MKTPAPLTEEAYAAFIAYAKMVEAKRACGDSWSADGPHQKIRMAAAAYHAEPSAENAAKRDGLMADLASLLGKRDRAKAAAQKAFLAAGFTNWSAAAANWKSVV